MNASSSRHHGAHGHNHFTTVVRPTELAVLWGLIVFLAFSTFAFGAIEDWSAATCEVLLFLLSGYAVWKRPDFLRFPPRLWAPFLFVLILIAVGLVQLIPLPTSYWHWIGDERATIGARAVEAETLLRSERYRTDPFTHKVLPEDQGPFQTPAPKRWIASTFTPPMTIRALIALFAAAALILLLEALSNDGREKLRGLALTGGVVGIGVGVIAVVTYHSKVTELLGFRKSAHAVGAFGPFINENNGMGFVNPAFCLLYYLIWRKIKRDRHRSNKIGLTFVLVGLALFHATILTIRTSDAGLWVLLLFPLVILLRLLKRRPRIALAFALLSATLVAGLAVFAIHYRFTDLHGRVGIWNNALHQDHYLVGNGLQSFNERFPGVLTNIPIENGKTMRYVYPENEYLQLYFEAGVFGLLAVGGMLLYVIVIGWRSIMVKGGAFLLVPALWGGALHAATDFDFHFWPVVGIYLLLIAVIQTALSKQYNHATPKEPVQVVNPGLPEHGFRPA